MYWLENNFETIFLVVVAVAWLFLIWPRNPKKHNADHNGSLYVLHGGALIPIENEVAAANVLRHMLQREFTDPNGHTCLHNEDDILRWAFQIMAKRAAS